MRRSGEEAREVEPPPETNTLRAVGVAEEHADCDASLGLVPEELVEGSVL